MSDTITDSLRPEKQLKIVSDSKNKENNIDISNSERLKLIVILEHLLKIGNGKLQDSAPATETFGNCPAVEGGIC
jgi:hypothetical protein